MEPPNDEAIAGHRLYDAGLRQIRWIGEVIGSSLIAEIEHGNRSHPRHDPLRYAQLRHWIVPLKECTVEVVAETLSWHREAATL